MRNKLLILFTLFAFVGFAQPDGLIRQSQIRGLSDSLGNYVKNNGTGTDNAFSKFDGATGKLIQDSRMTESDGGDVFIFGGGYFNDYINADYGIIRNSLRVGESEAYSDLSVRAKNLSGELVDSVYFDLNNSDENKFISLGLKDSLSTLAYDNTGGFEFGYYDDLLSRNFVAQLSIDSAGVFDFKDNTITVNKIGVGGGAHPSYDLFVHGQSSFWGSAQAVHGFSVSDTGIQTALSATSVDGIAFGSTSFNNISGYFANAVSTVSTLPIVQIVDNSAASTSNLIEMTANGSGAGTGIKFSVDGYGNAISDGDITCDTIKADNIGTISAKDFWIGTSAQYTANTAIDGILPQAANTIAYTTD